MEKRYISELDQYLFGEGIHYEIYNKLGAHFSVDDDGKEGVYFAVWAPHAMSVSVIGDFNNWDQSVNMMTKLEPLGIWELFIPEVKEGALYKYFIIGANGQSLYKADPFAFSAELRPGTASKVVNLDGYKWSDEKWMSEREKKDIIKEPVAIYECHIG